MWVITRRRIPCFFNRSFPYPVVFSSLRSVPRNDWCLLRDTILARPNRSVPNIDESHFTTQFVTAEITVDFIAPVPWNLEGETCLYIFGLSLICVNAFFFGIFNKDTVIIL